MLSDWHFKILINFTLIPRKIFKICSYMYIAYRTNEILTRRENPERDGHLRSSGGRRGQ